MADQDEILVAQGDFEDRGGPRLSPLYGDLDEAAHQVSGEGADVALVASVPFSVRQRPGTPLGNRWRPGSEPLELGELRPADEVGRWWSRSWTSGSRKWSGRSAQRRADSAASPGTAVAGEEEARRSRSGPRRRSEASPAAHKSRHPMSPSDLRTTAQTRRKRRERNARPSGSGAKRRRRTPRHAPGGGCCGRRPGTWRRTT